MKIVMQDNNPPKVVIRKPETKQSIKVPGVLQYFIEVKDTEDGFSGYQEIAAPEVFLRIQWVADKSKMASFQSEEKKFEKVYPIIAANGCLNCHAFKQKLAGPSFEQVTEKYSRLPGAVAALAGKVRSGSKGVWGDSQQMPAHPGLSDSESQLLIRWIFKYAADKNFQCLPGLEGTVALSPPSSKATGFYLLTAVYTDHGLNGINSKTSTSSLLLPMVQ